jgi:hypothetical protein
MQRPKFITFLSILSFLISLKHVLSFVFTLLLYHVYIIFVLGSIAFGLWFLKNWARWLAIAFGVFLILYRFYKIYVGILLGATLSTAFHMSDLIYLIFIPFVIIYLSKNNIKRIFIIKMIQQTAAPDGAPTARRG